VRGWDLQEMDLMRGTKVVGAVLSEGMAGPACPCFLLRIKMGPLASTCAPINQ
jgi:hypothetical protein